MGAECAISLTLIAKLYTNPRYRRKFTSPELRVSELLLVSLTRVAALGMQIYWAVNQSDDATLPWPFLNVPLIGYSAHIAGFLFGVLVGPMLG